MQLISCSGLSPRASSANSQILTPKISNHAIPVVKGGRLHIVPEPGYAVTFKTCLFPENRKSLRKHVYMTDLWKRDIQSEIDFISNVNRSSSRFSTEEPNRTGVRLIDCVSGKTLQPRAVVLSNYSLKRRRAPPCGERGAVLHKQGSRISDPPTPRLFLLSPSFCLIPERSVETFIW